jgi:exopolysaccharide biosynthesis polyprenyl glycosylphosphotransferase
MKSGPGLPRWLRHALRVLLHLACDSAAVALAYQAAYLARFHWDPWTSLFPFSGEDPGWRLYSRLLWAVVPIWLGIFHYSCGLYEKSWRGASDRFLQVLKGATLGTLAVLAATYIYSRLEYSRMMMLMAGPIALVLVNASQVLVLEIDSLLGRMEATSPLMLLGGGMVSELVRENLLDRHPGMRIIERTDLPRPEEIASIADSEGIGEVVLARGGRDHGTVLALAEACESAGLRFAMIPDLLELRLGEVQMDDSLGLPAYRLQHTSLTRANFLAKRAFDLAFSLLVLATLFLPLALVALIVKIDSRGPVFYRQKRFGLRGRVFEAFKFRTMAADAEKSLGAVKSKNSQPGGFFKAKDDPRVTRAGRWLRRFSIDEFPQFLNVLAGEMSVVGPRPLAVATGEIEALASEFGPTARKRLNILPGITGLWQVSGRSDISSEQRFALDLFYIEHWSLGLDLEIILKTVPAMLAARGAY